MTTTTARQNTAKATHCCPICGETSATRAFKKQEVSPIFKTLVCSACKFAYSFPRPTPAQLDEVYSSDYFEGNTGKVGYADYRDMPEANMHAMWKEFNEYAPLDDIRPRTILDVGCATGAFLSGAKAAGWNCIGIDRVDSALAVAREHYGIETINGDIADIDLPLNSIGVATMWHVLEHLVDPLASLKRAYELVAPGGLLFIEVPNWDSLGRVIRGPLWANLRPPEHISYFSTVSLPPAVKQAGFIVIRTSTHYPSIRNQAAEQRFNPIKQAANLAATIACSAGRGGYLRVLARKPKTRT
ncbi:MAG TPA: class I SAM-dependent methyltransferase [Planktothrix sp.]|jgi:2-polyprenyl-3-methyl-5-hydroxy-6-metoxy-1,4-benzoquinol methylase